MLDAADGAIDVHAHCVPQSLYERIEADGERFGIAVTASARGTCWTFADGFRSAPIEPGLLDAPGRIARMDERGVGLQLLSSFVDVGAQQVDGPLAARYARLFNDELAALVDAFPTRLRGLATLPVQRPEEAAAELDRAVRELGLVGAELAADGVGDPALEPLWATAAATRAVVLLHPRASTTSGLPYFLGNLVGNPAETTAAAATLIMSGILERHPDLVVVLVHGGGFLPYQAGRLQKGFDTFGDQFGAPLTVPPARQLRRMYYDTVLHDTRALSALVGMVGADRVLVGTDYPFAMGDPDPLRTVDAISGLTAHERQLLVRGNALGLLHAVNASRRGAASTSAAVAVA